MGFWRKLKLRIMRILDPVPALPKIWLGTMDEQGRWDGGAIPLETWLLTHVPRIAVGLEKGRKDGKSV